MALKVPIVPIQHKRTHNNGGGRVLEPYQATGTMTVGRAVPVGQERRAGEFLSPGQKDLPGAIEHLAGGVQRLGEVVHQREVQEQNAFNRIEFIKDMQALNVSTSTYLTEYAKNHPGELARNTVTDYLTQNSKQAEALKAKWKNHPEMIVNLTAQGGEIALNGWNSARKIQTEQFGEAVRQTGVGLMADALAWGGTHPDSWQAGLAPVAAFIRETNPGVPESYNQALTNEAAAKIFDTAFQSRLATGDLTGAEAMLGQAGGGEYATGPSGLVIPVAGARLTSPYGKRTRPKAGASSNHQATDLGAPLGTDIRAAATGRVVYQGMMGGYGETIVIQHTDGRFEQSQYAHMIAGSADGLNVGDTVSAGQIIGKVGSTGVSTGPHLDFKLKQNGQWIDPAPHLGLKAKGDRTPEGSGSSFIPPAQMVAYQNELGKARGVQMEATYDSTVAYLDDLDKNGSL